MRIFLVAVLVACGSKQAAPDPKLVDQAGMLVKKYAYEGYPSWSAAHAEKQCPTKIDELNEYVNTKDAKDPWGNALVMKCGPDLPAGAKGIAITSNGPDGKPDTADDIKSW